MRAAGRRASLPLWTATETKRMGPPWSTPRMCSAVGAGCVEETALLWSERAGSAECWWAEGAVPSGRSSAELVRAEEPRRAECAGGTVKARRGWGAWVGVKGPLGPEPAEGAVVRRWGSNSAEGSAWRLVERSRVDLAGSEGGAEWRPLAGALRSAAGRTRVGPGAGCVGLVQRSVDVGYARWAAPRRRCWGRAGLRGRRHVLRAGRRIRRHRCYRKFAMGRIETWSLRHCLRRVPRRPRALRSATTQ